MQRRQRRIRHVSEQRHLHFFAEALRLGDFQYWGFDMDRQMLVDALFFLFDDDIALLHRLRAYAFVLASLPGHIHPAIGRFQARAQPVGETQPGQAAEQAEACCDESQQQQRRAGKSQ